MTFRRRLTTKQEASPAQARTLAYLWGVNTTRPVKKHDDATTRKLVTEGWIVPTGETGEFPSGEPYEQHAVSPAGLYALERFLWKQRTDAIK